MCFSIGDEDDLASSAFDAHGDLLVRTSFAPMEAVQIWVDVDMKMGMCVGDAQPLCAQLC